MLIEYTIEKESYRLQSGLRVEENRVELRGKKSWRYPFTCGGGYRRKALLFRNRISAFKMAEAA